MPIQKSASGLIYFDDFESLTGWSFSPSANTVLSPNHVSGASSFATQSNSPYDNGISYAGGNPNVEWYAYKTIDVASISGRRVHLYQNSVQYGKNQQTHELYGLGINNASGNFRVGDSTATISSLTGFVRQDATIPDYITGQQQVRVASIFFFLEEPYWIGCYVDHLVVCVNDNVTLQGFIPGQKIELHRTSDKGLIASATVATGQSSVAISVLNEMFPESMYAIIYSTDGTTIIETTVSVEMCGGDVWVWTAPTSAFTAAATPLIIFRQVAVATPKTATITTTLIQPNGTPYAGKTITFSTSLGSLSAASATTSSEGQASVTLTSPATQGIAVVQCTWAGDGTVPAATVYLTVHVFYDAEAPDGNKDFQFFCEGIEYPFTSGNYMFATDGVVGTFEAVLPEWDSTLTVRGLVSIYRFGVKEFAGVLSRVDNALSESPQVTLRGTDASALLATRVIDYQAFLGVTPAAMVSGLLAILSCGIVPGLLADYGSTIVLIFDIVTALAAVQAICDAIGWAFRINSDLSLDLAGTLGVDSNATFTEGVNLITNGLTQDASILYNRMHVRGQGMTSTKANTNSLNAVGLREGVDLRPTIADRATLDGLAQAEADWEATLGLAVEIEVKDDYAVGEYSPGDTVDVESPTLGLSGRYQVKTITRNLIDANYAQIALNARKPESWETNASFRRLISELMTVT